MDEPLDEFIQIFSQMGFSSNEIKILIELYKSKEPKKADELSKLTDVSLTRTYEALDLLEQKRFVRVLTSRPRLYQVEAPHIAISNYVEMMQQKYEERMQTTKKLANKLLKYAQDLYLQFNTLIEPDDLLVQISSLEEAEQQTLKLIKSAEKEILIFTHVFQWFYSIEEELVKAIKRGCSVRIMMQTSPIDPSVVLPGVKPLDPEYLRGLGIDVRDLPPNGIMTRGTLIDRKAVIFVIWADDNTQKRQRRIYRPQYSSNPGIVEVFYGYFSYLWQSQSSH